MKIIADENIPYVRDAFSTIGEVVTLPGRGMTKTDLNGAEVLAVRSVTKVNADLLDGTPVKCVVTATIGTDHLDIPYLEGAGVQWASAPGCNAESVGDYIVSSLLVVAERQGTSLEGKTIGVIGCGNVGSRVVKRARGMGMNVLENDPPLARETGDERYRPLDELFVADYLTAHTPLTHEGQDATYHLLDQAFLGRMKPGAVLLNSGRGAVADNVALKAALREKRIDGAVLDVWEGEPRPDPELAALVDVATPHIAGYSFDGKIGGLMQIYQAVCGWLGIKASWNPATVVPEPEFPRLEIDADGRSDEEILRKAAWTIYPIRRDDSAMREALSLDDSDERAAAFDRLRKEYPRRREFSLTTVSVNGGSENLGSKLAGIGFRVSPEI